MNLICSLRLGNFFKVQNKKIVIALVTSLSNLISNLMCRVENKGTCKAVLWNWITKKRRISGISVVFDRYVSNARNRIFLNRGKITFNFTGWKLILLSSLSYILCWFLLYWRGKLWSWILLLVILYILHHSFVKCQNI